MDPLFRISRRRMLVLSGATLASGAAAAAGLSRTPAQTSGPFYPLEKPLDRDADLTDEAIAAHVTTPLFIPTRAAMEATSTSCPATTIYRAPANYGANYERLAAVKATYDPDNLFHINQNIAPANGS